MTLPSNILLCVGDNTIHVNVNVGKTHVSPAHSTNSLSLGLEQISNLNTSKHFLLYLLWAHVFASSNNCFCRTDI